MKVAGLDLREKAEAQARSPGGPPRGGRRGLPVPVGGGQGRHGPDASGSGPGDVTGRDDLGGADIQRG